MAENILIVDNDPSHRLLYRIYIEEHIGGDFAVIEASDAESAFEMIARERPACVLLDNMMHGENGFHLLHRLKRAMPDHPPIIFMSGSMPESLRKNAEALGAALCLAKSSMGKEQLIRAIEEVTR